MTEAFNQIMRYRMHTYTGLFRYIQIFVISNSQETRYFSNSDGEILKSQMFLLVRCRKQPHQCAE